MRLFVFGQPGPLGGACTELWHTLKLWRQHGVDICLLDTWRSSSAWRSRCDKLGIVSLSVAEPATLREMYDIRGSIVVGFCSTGFLRSVGVLRQLRCRLIWVSCMTRLFAAEHRVYRRFGPFDAYVFQSDYQKSTLLAALERFGVTEDRCFRIPGAFDVDEYPFRPRKRDDGRFIVGRLARPSLEKWGHNTWRVYQDIAFPGRRARVMGWSEALRQNLGLPPAWAEALAPCAELSQTFLASLDCYVAVNGGARENWPQVGLEAMACGVPLVVERAWGWPEMIEHGRNGLLASTEEELSQLATELAHDEPRRQRLIEQARVDLTTHLANVPRIWQAWSQLFATCLGRNRT